MCLVYYMGTVKGVVNTKRIIRYNTVPQKNCNCVKCTVTASKLRKHMLFVVIYKEIGKLERLQIGFQS